MALINSSGIIGQIIIGMSTNITGSDTLTFLLILAAMVGIMAALRCPIPLMTVFITPFVIILMGYSQTFLIVGGIILLLEAVIIIRYFF